MLPAWSWSASRTPAIVTRSNDLARCKYWVKCLRSRNSRQRRWPGGPHWTSIQRDTWQAVSHEPHATRPGLCLASLHSDEGRAAASPDCSRRGRLPFHRRWAKTARRHFVMVGEYPRALAAEIERSAERAGGKTRTRVVRRA